LAYKDNVFINCPFDNDYYVLLKPLLFVCVFLKLKPQISQTNNSDDIRINQIKNLIKSSRYSIHDLSRLDYQAAIDPANPNAPENLPRLNMPFELGIDVGCKTYLKKDKKYIILENEPHRFKVMLSDISGQDIFAHRNKPFHIVKIIRNWCAGIFPRREIVSTNVIWDAYNEFAFDFEEQMNQQNLDPDVIGDIPFSELIDILKNWIKNYLK
jgi:hypothetical protein